MKKLVLLILLSVAVYGADSTDSKASNKGYDKCVEILKEFVPPLYVNVAYYNILPFPERAKPYCTTLGLYLNLYTIPAPKQKEQK